MSGGRLWNRRVKRGFIDEHCVNDQDAAGLANGQVADMKKIKIAQGNTAEIYNWGTDCILKLYRDGIPISICQNEFDRTKGAYNLIKVVPRPVDIVNDDGKVGAVYQKVNGKTMLKEMMSKPWLFRKYAKQLAIYHVDMQKPVDFELPTVKEKLKQDIEAAILLTEDEKQRLYKYIGSLPDGSALCHFDYHPDNVMLSINNYTIIDWMTACKGDKLSDVARTCVILSFSKIPRVPAIVNFVLGVFQKQIFKIYLNEYLRITNARTEDIKKWEMPVAAARLCEWIPEQEQQALLTFVRKNLEKQYA
jgi:hypothetical protein